MIKAEITRTFIYRILVRGYTLRPGSFISKPPGKTKVRYKMPVTMLVTSLIFGLLLLLLSSSCVVESFSVIRNSNRGYSNQHYIATCNGFKSRFSCSNLVLEASSSDDDDDDDDLPSLSSSGRLPDNYQEIGNQLIYQAAKSCGAPEEALKIEWKNDKIIVTVNSDSVYVSSSSDEEDEDDILDDYDYDDDEGDEEEEMEDMEFIDDEIYSDEDLEYEDYEDDDDIDDDGGGGIGIDVTELARAINRVLEDDGTNGSGVGLTIAEKHSIEVTTPGASDELQGKVMFEAYKGFDVICSYTDIRKKDKQEVEKEITGKLVERTDDETTFNLKGRMKSIKNDKIIYVKLPKAKKEKGAR